MNSLFFLIVQLISLYKFVLIVYIIMTWVINFNVINTSRDRYQYGELDFSRGGLWVYFVPGLGIRVSETITIDLQYPLPIYQFVNESQLVPSDLLTMNFSYTLSKE